MSNRLFNGERYTGGFPDLNKAGQGSPRGGRVGGGFAICSLGDSQARWTGGSDRSPGRGVARQVLLRGWGGRLQLAKCAVFGPRDLGRLPLGTSPPAGEEESGPSRGPDPALPTAFVMLFLPYKISSIPSISKAPNPTSSNGQIYSLEMLCRT